MKILSIKSLALPEIRVIKFARFLDQRGYFCEPFRESDLLNSGQVDFLKGQKLVQQNENFSKANVARGLHFQWNPYMGKLVRTVKGRMVDMAMDIRKGSPNFGKIILYDMPINEAKDYNEWIWLPPGFAHGNFFVEETIIEYFCSGEYNPVNEAGISFLSTDLDWSLCDVNLKNLFDETIRKAGIISEKDKQNLTLKQWESDPRSENFKY